MLSAAKTSSVTGSTRTAPSPYRKRSGSRNLDRINLCRGLVGIITIN